MKKILVTGADGFIGSHLVELLLAEGHKVKALSQYNSFNYWGWLESVELNDNLEIISGDVRDQNFCNSLTKNVDLVFNLAALIAIPFSYSSPDSYIQTNIVGTMNMCHAALNNNVDRIVHTSTSEVYGTAQYIPIDENHPFQPQSPYSASKISADAMAMSFFNSFDLPLVIARPFNAFGPRQSARAIIPSIIIQIANGKKEIRLGDLTPTRDFTYVEDTCLGFLSLAEADSVLGETYNIGSNFEVSIKETLEAIQKIMGTKVKVITDNQRLRTKKSEVFRLFSDNRKIEKATGFKPKVKFEEGLERTIEWFTKKENLKNYKSEIYNV